MQDQEIVDMYFERDERAIVRTEQQYGHVCFGVAMRILRNRQDSEECVNDTLLKAWNSIPPTRPHSLSAYLCRIARNLAINRWEERNSQKRGGGLYTSLEELGDCIPESAEDSGQLTELYNEFLDRLEPLERNIFLGRYWHNYTPDTLAATYGMSRNAIHLRLMRTRDKFRIFLEERGFHV